MVRHNLEYPRDVHNTVNRYKHQGADYLLYLLSLANNIQLYTLSQLFTQL
jgi:hypothetical protein